MMANRRRIALVLGGGGLKGFAHIGVLRALEELGVEPDVIAGTSIGALIAAAHAGAMPVGEMQRRAEALRRKDLFRVDRLGMIIDRMSSTSIYMEEPLRELVRAVVPQMKFDELGRTLLVNTVDIEHGTQVVWGLPGMRDVSIGDAVYASCALPGFFPPGRVGRSVCIDGGVIDNLPASVAAVHADGVIAVDVGSFDLQRAQDIEHKGFASVYMRSATVMMHALQQFPFGAWQGPPMVLIRPKLGHIPWLSFSNTREIIEQGYIAAKGALTHLDDMLSAAGGVWPQRKVELFVDPAKCIRCGLCIGMAPSVMGWGADGKAVARERFVIWSPADGEFVRHCPTKAIIATTVETEQGAKDQENATSLAPASRS
jgi:NTE family protein